MEQHTDLRRIFLVVEISSSHFYCKYNFLLLDIIILIKINLIIGDINNEKDIVKTFIFLVIENTSTNMIEIKFSNESIFASCICFSFTRAIMTSVTLKHIGENLIPVNKIKKFSSQF